MKSLMRLPLLLFTLSWQSAFLALGQIWANKVRAALTTVGIVIGVASVTAVIAALTGLKQNVLAEFASLGTNKLFIQPHEPEGVHVRWTRIRFTPDLFDGILEHCPSVKAFARQTNVTLNVSYGTHSEKEMEVSGIEPAWHEIENRTVTLGRPFSLIDLDQHRPVCLINAKLQEKLALPRDPTNEMLLIGQRRYRIVGVVEPRTDSMFTGGRTASEAFIPFTLAYRSRYQWLEAVATCRSPDVSDEAKAEISFFLRKKRRIAVGDPDTFEVEAVQKLINEFNSLATAITAVAAGIVGISLVVGGVGIMNIMLVSVSERTREIGLRKAVGARPGAILLQFLIEAVMLCLMGGVVGLVIGEALTRLMKQIPSAKLEKAYIPLWAIAVSFGFAASVGLIFGMFPAIKAARLDPIDALRHE